MARSFVYVNFGQQDTLTIPNNSAMNTTSGCFAFWMQMPFGGYNGNSPFSMASQFASFIPFSGSTLYPLTIYFGSTGSPNAIIRGSAIVNDGNWHHIAVNWNLAPSSFSTLYVDGVLDSTSSAFGGTLIFSADLILSSPNGSGANNGLTYFGEVSWRNSQLTPDEILGLAKGVLPNTIRPGNLVFYLPLWT